VPIKAVSDKYLPLNIQLNIGIAVSKVNPMGSKDFGAKSGIKKRAEIWDGLVV